MRELDKNEDFPALGPPINRPAPPAPVVQKISDNVSEVSGRMFTEIARNVAAPADSATTTIPCFGPLGRMMICRPELPTMWYAYIASQQNGSKP
jgi:hypothetical protein